MTKLKPIESFHSASLQASSFGCQLARMSQVWTKTPEGLSKELCVKILKLAVCLSSVLFAVTLMSSPTAAARAADLCSVLPSSPFGFLLIACGAMGLGVVITRRKGLYKVPVKLAALLLCFYGSALAASSYNEGLPALAPYCLMTFALLLVIFW